VEGNDCGVFEDTILTFTLRTCKNGKPQIMWPIAGPRAELGTSEIRQSLADYSPAPFDVGT
jgi:hypothetical protein